MDKAGDDGKIPTSASSLTLFITNPELFTTSHIKLLQI